MPWTEITRPKYRRDGLKYASDPTFMPTPHRLGRPRGTDLRVVVNALFYILSSGCQWRLLPRDFPPRSTIQGYFYRWRDDGSWARINHHLLMAAREAAGREASPSAGVIDSQSVCAKRGVPKTTEAGGPRGYDARKKIQGPKAPHRHPYDGLACGGDCPCRQDLGPRRRSAAAGVDPRCFPVAAAHLRRRPGYAGDKLKAALAKRGRWTLAIVKRAANTEGFQVLPRRWVVERTLAWLNRNRRLACLKGMRSIKDFDASITSAESWIMMASVKLLSRRITRT